VVLTTTTSASATAVDLVRPDMWCLFRVHRSTHATRSNWKGYLKLSVISRPIALWTSHLIRAALGFDFSATLQPEHGEPAKQRPAATEQPASDHVRRPMHAEIYPADPDHDRQK
jgi:hypothetical protein